MSERARALVEAEAAMTGAENGADGEDGELEAFLEHLYSLELRPNQLRRDPYGASWLAPEWQAIVRDDPRYMAQLRHFVEEELELYDSVRGQADAFFTARVIEATAPEQIAGLGLAPRYRGWILACAYAMATVAAVMIIRPWWQGDGAWTTVHAAVSHGLGGALGGAQTPALAGSGGGALGLLLGLAALVGGASLLVIRKRWGSRRA